MSEVVDEFLVSIGFEPSKLQCVDKRGYLYSGIAAMSVNGGVKVGHCSGGLFLSL